MGGGRPDVGFRAAADMEEPCARGGVREGGLRFRMGDVFWRDSVGLLIENDGVTVVVSRRGPCEGGIFTFIRKNGEVVDVEPCVFRIDVAVSVDGGGPCGKFGGDQACRR